MKKEFLEATADKFTFRADTSCLYHLEETWAREEDGLITVGVTDFFQTNAGDVAYINPPKAGSKVIQNQEAGNIETIKTSADIISPLSGMVEAINTRLENEPELINQDAYGEGWIMKVKPINWEEEKSCLISAGKYFPLMEEKIKAKLNNK